MIPTSLSDMNEWIAMSLLIILINTLFLSPHGSYKVNCNKSATTSLELTTPLSRLTKNSLGNTFKEISGKTNSTLLSPARVPSGKSMSKHSGCLQFSRYGEDISDRWQSDCKQATSRPPWNSVRNGDDPGLSKSTTRRQYATKFISVAFSVTGRLEERWPILVSNILSPYSKYDLYNGFLLLGGPSFAVSELKTEQIDKVLRKKLSKSGEEADVQVDVLSGKCSIV